MQFSVLFYNFFFYKYSVGLSGVKDTVDITMLLLLLDPPL